MTQERTEGQTTVLRLLGGTADDYDKVVAESTGGWDGRWKRWILDRMDAPRRVLDLASGTGILSFMVLDRFEDVHLTGVDLQADYLAVAEARAEQRGQAERTTFIHAPVEDVDLPAGSFDHVVTCYLPKYAVRPVLAERLARWCAPGAKVLLQDFAHPTDPKVERALKQQYDRWQAKVARESPHWISCFDGLYDVVKASPWTEDLPPLLREAGFEDVSITRHAYGCAATVVGTWPG